MRRLPLIGPFVQLAAQPFSQSYIYQVKKQLDEISPSLCAAKWYQTTLHLGNAETHSCHHPPRHSIPFENLKLNPSALHNTPYKKEQRKLMLQGKRPAECSYCWKVEDAGENLLSDRHYKSGEDWAMGLIEGLKDLKGDEDVIPRYLEVSFSSLCQLKCSYCDPYISSSIAKEIETFGPYPTSQEFGKYSPQVINQQEIKESFWKWWPQIKNDLKVLRLTGGEPLLHEDVFKVLEDLKQHPSPKLKLSITSNLMIAQSKLDDFLSLSQLLIQKKSIQNLHLYTSIDTWGEQAEWLRAGLKISTYTTHLERALNLCPQMEVTILVTFNILSLFKFKELLEYVLWLRNKFPQSQIKVGVSYLQYPQFLSVDTLPRHCAHLFEEIIQFYHAHSISKRGTSGFSPSEIARFERIYSSWKESTVIEGLSDLEIFIKNYDQRKGLNFNQVFPDFWTTVKGA